MKENMRFGIIVGNRGFFPDHLAKRGRQEMISTVAAAGYDAVCLTPEQYPPARPTSDRVGSALRDLPKTFRAPQSARHSICGIYQQGRSPSKTSRFWKEQPRHPVREHPPRSRRSTCL